MTALKYGDTAARKVSERIAAPFATLAAMAAINASNGAVDGMLAHVISSGRLWRFNATSVVTADNQFVAGTGTGRWLLEPGLWDVSLPITFATADAAVLETLPTGVLLFAEEYWWEVTADWTGGASSAIGVSSTKTGFTTKGDLLGGTAGNVAATLVASGGHIIGTIGTGFDTLAKRRVLFKGGDVLARFDRITSAFTAGTGNVHVAVHLLKNPGV